MKKRLIGSYLMALVGLSLIFYVLVAGISSEHIDSLEIGLDEEHVSVNKMEIKEYNLSLYNYILHLQIAIGGLLVFLGATIVLLSWYGVRKGSLWAWTTSIIAFLGLVSTVPAHYPLGLASFAHLGYLYFAIGIYVVGVILSCPKN